MSILIPAYTLDATVRLPANKLLSLASSSLRSLHSHYWEQHAVLESKADEDAAADVIENIVDVEQSLQAIDPKYWKEIVDKRLDKGVVPQGWSQPEVEQRAQDRTRLQALLTLGTTPKAFWVIPEAVKYHREQRRSAEPQKGHEDEDALLDLLVFLAEKRERAGLFGVVE